MFIDIYLLLLLVISVGFLIYSYYFNNKDIAEPNTGTFLVCSISMVFALIGNSSWRKEFLLETFIYLLIGFAVITCTSLFIRKNKIRLVIKANESKIISFKEFRRIEISYKIILTTLISLFLTIIYVFSVKTRGIQNVNFWIRQGIKIVMATAYVNSFIFVNNFMSKKRKHIDLILLIPTLCGFICSYFTGVRTEILRLIIAVLIYFVVLIQERNSWKSKKEEIKKIISKAIIPLLLFLMAFFVMRSVIKDADIGENMHYGFLMYLAFYIGSPWVVFNQKIALGIANYRGTVFGHLTFGVLWDDIIDFGLFHGNRVPTKTFTSLDDTLQVNGNVDTMFGSPLIDFGPIGMLVFIGITYLFLNWFYFKYIKNSYSSPRRNLKLVFYAFFYYIVAISFYSCGVTFIVSFYYIITLILIWVIWQFYFKLKF